jgi:hypothetical protein
VVFVTAAILDLIRASLLPLNLPDARGIYMLGNEEDIIQQGPTGNRGQDPLLKMFRLDVGHLTSTTVHYGEYDSSNDNLWAILNHARVLVSLPLLTVPSVHCKLRGEFLAEDRPVSHLPLGQLSACHISVSAGKVQGFDYPCLCGTNHESTHRYLWSIIRHLTKATASYTPWFTEI